MGIKKAVRSFAKKTMKTFGKDTIDDLGIAWNRHMEKKKFADPRRIKIYSTVQLSDDQKKAIDDLYLNNYGEKIPYVWHQHYTAFTGSFDVNYFPELLCIPEFEHFMNQQNAYRKVFDDKRVTPLVAKALNIQTPHTFISTTEGIYINSEYQQVSKSEALESLKNVGPLFCKPSANTNSGRGCFAFNIENGIDTLSGKSIGDILNSLGNNYLFQERVKCHSSIETLYAGSVNTFRIITYRWKDEIRHIPMLMRLGQGGSYLDNVHAGGTLIAIDDDGTLHKTAFTEFDRTYTEHPDTHIKYEGYKIPGMQNVISTAKRMHMAIPEIGCVNWDFTIGSDGSPILMEANLGQGSIWACELAHGRGAFGENTAEVLRWMRKMKKTKASERWRFAFGR